MAELQTTHSAGKTQLSVKIQIQGDRRLELLRRSENLRERTNLPGNELLVPRPHPFVQTRSLADEIWVCPGGWRGCRAPRRQLATAWRGALGAPSVPVGPGATEDHRPLCASQWEGGGGQDALASLGHWLLSRSPFPVLCPV